MKAVEIVIGGAVLTVFMTMLKLAFSRITKMEDKVVLRDPCKERHGVIQRELTRGEEHLNCLDLELKIMKEILTRIDERVKELAKKNGIG